MALIKCLECGKEISDKATVCIHCGCPVSEAETVCAKEEIDNDTTYCKACMNCGYIYWNPVNSSYQEGYCSNCKCEREKRKLNKFDYTLHISTSLSSLCSNNHSSKLSDGSVCAHPYLSVLLQIRPCFSASCLKNLL